MTNATPQTAVADQPKNQLNDLEFASIEVIIERNLLKTGIVGCWLTDVDLVVDQAWGELNALTKKRFGGAGLSDVDVDRFAELTQALWSLGLEYVQSRPQWDLELEGVLLLKNPKALLKARPELEMCAPIFHMGTLIVTRIDYDDEAADEPDE